MRAKDYLNRIAAIDLLIENKLAEVERWKSIAAKSTASISGARVQTSGSGGMDRAVCEYIALEDTLKGEIADLSHERGKIITTIESLGMDEYSVIYKLYVQKKELYQIAEDLERSYSWVCKKHRSGVASVQEMLDEIEQQGEQWIEN